MIAGRSMLTVADRADDLDHMLFNAANRLERLAEETGDEALRTASRIVASQRHRVRAHMAEAMRKRAPN